MFISKVALKVLLEQSKTMGPLFIPTIVWAEDEHGIGAWEVGFHRRVIVPDAWIEEIEGIGIVIEPHWHDELKDMTLDVVDGYFQVTERNDGPDLNV